MNRKWIRRKKKRKEEKEIRIDERKEKRSESRMHVRSRRFLLTRRPVQASESFFVQIFDFLVEVDSEFLDSINFYQFLPQNRWKIFKKVEVKFLWFLLILRTLLISLFFSLNILTFFHISQPIIINITRDLWKNDEMFLKIFREAKYNIKYII